MVPIHETPKDERQDSDDDGAWKELLRSHLKESIENCFPRLAELIDWNFEPEWLDKERYWTDWRLIGTATVRW